MITAEWWMKRLTYFSLDKHNVQYSNVDDKQDREEMITRNKNRKSKVLEVVTGVIVANTLWEDMGSREGKRLLWILKRGTDVFGWKRQGKWSFEQTNNGCWKMELVLTRDNLTPANERIAGNEQDEIRNWEDGGKYKELHFLISAEETKIWFTNYTNMIRNPTNKNIIDETYDDGKSLLSNWYARDRFLDTGEELRRFHRKMKTNKNEDLLEQLI